MKRKIRKEIYVSVEMSERQANNIRIILYNLTDKHCQEIMAEVGITDPDYLAEIRESAQELCLELEIAPIDKFIHCEFCEYPNAVPLEKISQWTCVGCLRDMPPYDPGEE